MTSPTPVADRIYFGGPIITFEGEAKDAGITTTR